MNLDPVPSLIRDIRHAFVVARHLKDHPDTSASDEDIRTMAGVLAGLAGIISSPNDSSFSEGVLAGLRATSGGQMLPMLLAQLRDAHPAIYAEVTGLMADMGQTSLVDRLMGEGIPQVPWAMDALHFSAQQARPPTKAVKYTLDDVIAGLPRSPLPCAKHGDPACFECIDFVQVQTRDVEVVRPQDHEMDTIWQQALRSALAEHGHAIDPITSATMMAAWCDHVAKLAGVDEVVVGTRKGDYVCMPGMPAAADPTTWTQLTPALHARFISTGTLEVSVDGRAPAMGFEVDEIAPLVTFVVQQRRPDLADPAAAADLIVATGGHGYDGATGVPRLANGMDRVCYDTKTKTIVVQVDRDIPVDLQPNLDGRLRVVTLDAAGDDPGGRLIEVTCPDEPPRVPWLWRAWDGARTRICDCGIARGATREEAVEVAWATLGGPHMGDVVHMDVTHVGDGHQGSARPRGGLEAAECAAAS